MYIENKILPIILEKFKEVGAEQEPVKIFHIRNESDQNKDVWNDHLCFIDKTGNIQVSIGTTDPGTNAYHRHPEGAAHMCLGWHKNIWVIDVHARNNVLFAHEALCSRPQRGCLPIKYWRDENKNRIYDSNDIILDNFIGINCHRASKIKDVSNIGDYSDACQVRLSFTDHMSFMAKIKEFDCVKDSFTKGVYTYKFSCLLLSNKEIDI